MADWPETALHEGARLARYRIVEVLGLGGFGITYLAEDTELHRRVAIKEYFPREIAARTKDGESVVPHSKDSAEDYEWGLDRFKTEARILAAVHHPNVILVYDYLDGNGTAYMVMEYQDGATLAQVLQRGPLEQSEIEDILEPLLSGLETVHGKEILHRDIKPANIFIRSNGQPVMLDFGAARQAVGSLSKPLTSIVSAGYAPIEQYSSQSRQGPWSDLYALGATLYACMTGAGPPESTARMLAVNGGQPDPLRPVAEAARQRSYDPGLMRAVDGALRIEERDRPQSVGEFRALLGADKTPPPVAKQPPRRGRAPLYAGAGLLLAGLLAGGWLTLAGPGEDPPQREEVGAERGDADGTGNEEAATEAGSDDRWRRAVLAGELTGHRRNVWTAAFSPDGTRLVTAGKDGTARLWNVDEGGLVAILRGHDDDVRMAAFSPDGTRLATASFDDTARVWNAATGAETAVLSGHGQTVWTVRFSPDGGRVVTGSYDGTARIWNAATGEQMRILDPPGGSIWRALFSPDGETVLTASGGRTAILWGAASGAVRHRLAGHRSNVLVAAFDPAGRMAATGTEGGRLHLWNVGTGARLHSIDAHSADLIAIQFDDGGQRLLTSSADGTAKMWDTRTGRMILALEGHAGTVWSAGFGPRGRHILTNAQDNSARIWSAEDGSQIAVLRAPEGETMHNAVFSPRGDLVATTHSDGRVRLWAPGE